MYLNITQIDNLKIIFPELIKGLSLYFCWQNCEQFFQFNSHYHIVISSPSPHHILTSKLQALSQSC